MTEMEKYFSTKVGLNISLALMIADKYDLADSLVVDLSKIIYTPGIVGITQDSDNGGYLVYEIDKNKICNIVLSACSEEEACVEALSSLGIKFSQ